MMMLPCGPLGKSEPGLLRVVGRFGFALSRASSYVAVTVYCSQAFSFAVTQAQRSFGCTVVLTYTTPTQ